MQKEVIVDLKLLSTGVGLGGLICALAAFNPVGAMVGLLGTSVALALRVVEARL